MRQSHSYLCGDCQGWAVAAEAQAVAGERERQEQERLRQKVEEQATAQKAAGWLFRFRSRPGQSAVTDHAGKIKVSPGKPALSVAAATLIRCTATSSC
ncbi:hypothetical protein GCM10018980_20090 [Streptomyces capoamus]|uniref:Uncharacterized protein n=1 Tax=Streptomyces capoamus TaxID=68183 RepID=A0A919C5B5_9ACTN|nr:hypothetical protein [Streptomyces capoamus]GGW16600.1 hypothetical protein GCM10010501_33690 [Streptomyces libani subsp. rufus]GHG43272.1 hypothetical protein GCM10018980_20090 [Streptomyces capoamus]